MAAGQITGAQFRTTHWSLVLEAGSLSSREKALEHLCGQYWFPLYTFVRRRGYPPHEAQDLTQEFFRRLLESEMLNGAAPEKGRFRTFLMAGMKHLIAKEWRDANRQKRGGGHEIFSWDGLNPEERFQCEPGFEGGAEATFDRHWAQAVVAAALEKVRREFEREGSLPRFETLKIYLQGDGSADAYLKAAQTLGMSEAAVKSAIFRLRRRYAEAVREEVRSTVAEDADVEEEIQHLIAILARG